MANKGEIAVISMVRNDIFFADKWIEYYGTQFGFKNLYLFIDGLDQDLPKKANKINYAPAIILITPSGNFLYEGERTKLQIFKWVSTKV